MWWNGLVGNDVWFIRPRPSLHLEPWYHIRPPQRSFMVIASKLRNFDINNFISKCRQYRSLGFNTANNHNHSRVTYEMKLFPVSFFYLGVLFPLLVISFLLELPTSMSSLRLSCAVIIVYAENQNTYQHVLNMFGGTCCYISCFLFTPR